MRTRRWAARLAVARGFAAYCGYDSKIMVLEDLWREPLGAISAESLAAEGFETLDEFRRHWIGRERRLFPPLRITTVYRIRPWTPDDDQAMAECVLRHLYGEHLPAAA